jgi:isoquinoline 1-oxidoreductase subunit beta
VVNPNIVRAQIEGAIIFGVTAALNGAITLKDGRVEQANFDTYQMLRINEAPAIEVHIVQSSKPPGGVGEPGTSAIVPRSPTRSLRRLTSACGSCRSTPRR